MGGGRGIVSQVEARRGRAMWRCDCGYVNGDAPECERCSASAPSEEREYTIQDLWDAASRHAEQSTRRGDQWSTDSAPGAGHGTPPRHDRKSRPAARRTVVGIILLNVVFQ